MLLLLLTAGLLLLPACSNTATDDPLIGKPAPLFQAKALDGSTFSLGDAAGKTIIINFWSTTCPPCVEEMPSFQQLQNKLVTRSDSVLLMIDLNDDLTTVQNFVQKNKYTFRVFLDSGYTSAQLYNIRYTPTTVLIDRQGIARIYKIGAFANFADIEKQTSPYLK